MWREYAYKSLPYVCGVILFIELGLGILRLTEFFEYQDTSRSNSSAGLAQNRMNRSPLMSSQQSIAAFALDWIGSVVTTLMGIYVGFFLLLIGFCSCTFRSLRDIFIYKSNHRFILLTYNCPCYKARSRLRLQIRVGLLSFFIFLRILAVVLYAKHKTTGDSGKLMAILCAISIAVVAMNASNPDMFVFFRFPF
jgi:hypothetical protein